MEKENKIYNVVDINTGEIINHIREGDQIIRGKFEVTDEKFIPWNCGNFVKGNQQEIKPLAEELSYIQSSLLFVLMPYVSYKSCLISYPNGKDINLQTISELFGSNIKTASKVTGQLIKMHILYKGRIGNNNQYFMNPWVMYKGNYINKTLKAMFKDYQIRSLGNVKWKDLK